VVVGLATVVVGLATVVVGLATVVVVAVGSPVVTGAAVVVAVGSPVVTGADVVETSSLERLATSRFPVSVSASESVWAATHIPPQTANTRRAKAGFRLRLGAAMSAVSFWPSELGFSSAKPSIPSGGGGTSDPATPSGGGGASKPSIPSGGGGTSDPATPSGGGGASKPSIPSGGGGVSAIRRSGVV